MVPGRPGSLEEQVRQVVARVVGRGLPPREGLLAPVGVSARHIHLSPEHVEALFGPGARLHPIKDLQPGQYAAGETVTLVGPGGSQHGVRVLGPARGRTQVEIAASDGFQLGIHPPVRLSGDVAGTPGIAVVGPHGAIRLAEGVIVAKRHLHITPDEAGAWGLSQGQLVRVEATGERALTFGQVVVRVDRTFRLELHIDTDEANAAGLRNGDLCHVCAARPVQEG